MKLDDIKPGMLIKGYGLVISVREQLDLCYYSASSPEYGGLCCNVDKDAEFEILYEIGTKGYFESIKQIQSGLFKMVNVSFKSLAEVDKFKRQAESK